MLWPLIPLLFAIPDVGHYLRVKSPVQPPPSDWKQEYFENDIVFPAAWLAKELLTGLIIGYLLGRDVARRHGKSTLPTSSERNENVAPNGTPS